MAEKAQATLTAIYALSDSDGVIRYVGKANDPRARFLQHKSKSKTGRTPLYAWMRSASNVSWSVLEWAPTDSWEEAERRLIAKHRSTLVNVAKGGNQPAQPGTEEGWRIWRAKKAFSAVWRYMSEEERCCLRERWMPTFRRWAKESHEIANHIKGLGYII